MGDKVDGKAVLSDNGGVVEFVSVSLRVLKRAPVPAVSGVRELLRRWRMYDPTQESVWVLAFDSQRSLRKVTRIATGSYDEVEVPLPAMLTAVVMAAADRFWLVHNHPGGNPTPSRADMDLTTKAMTAANACGLRMEDHIILAPPNKSFSLREARMIQDAEEVAAVAANQIVVSPVRLAHRTDVQEER